MYHYCYSVLLKVGHIEYLSKKSSHKIFDTNFPPLNNPTTIIEVNYNNINICMLFKKYEKGQSI